MPTATVTTKGQVTIPKEVREHLGVETGDRLSFVVQEDGTVIVKPITHHVRELGGLLQRSGHDLERHPHHVRVDVASLARPPPGDRALRLLGHRGRVHVEALLVERREHELALVQPAVAVGQQQAA